MQIAQQLEGNHLCQRGTEQDRRTDPSRDRSPRLVDVLHGIVVDGVAHFMTEPTGQLLGVFDEVEQRIGDVDIAAGRGKRVRLGLVYEQEFEWVLMFGLCYPGDRLGYRPQSIIQK